MSDAFWTKISATGPIPIPRENTPLVLVDRKLYLFGGTTGFDSTTGVSNELWSLDLSLTPPRWEEPMTIGYPPGPRTSHGLWLLGSVLVLYGGYSKILVEYSSNELDTCQPSASPFTNSVYMLDLNFMFWSRMYIGGHLPHSQFSSTVLPDLINPGTISLPLCGGAVLGVMKINEASYQAISADLNHKREGQSQQPRGLSYYI